MPQPIPPAADGLCHDPWLMRHLGHDQDALHTADSASPVGCGGASRGKHRSSAYALTWPPGQTRILNAPSLRSAARTGPWRDVLTSAQLLAGIDNALAWRRRGV